MNGGENSAHVRFEDPRRVLARHGLYPKKSWGQNFLVNAGAVATIARACVDRPGRRVLEIGPGLGTLTAALLSQGAKVTAVERDRQMCEVLAAELADEPDFTLVEADAARFDLSSWLEAGPGVVAGNLPYHITGKLVRRAVEASPPPLRSVLMMQVEVAQRLRAQHKTRERAALSVMTQLRCDVRIIARLAPGSFHPPPKVSSAVVELLPHERSRLSCEELARVDTLVKAAFAQRRKTLRNNLTHIEPAPPLGLETAFEKCGISGGARAETLSSEDFVALAQALDLI